MKRIAVCVAAVVVTACVPMRMTYFEPSGDGQVLNSPCGGSPNRLRIKLPQGVLADVEMVRTAKDNLSVSSSYYVPDGVSIQLMSGVTRVVDAVSEGQQDLAPLTVRQQCGTGTKDYACERTVPPTTPMEGATIKDGSLFGLSKSDRGLFYRVDVPSSAKAFVIKLPDIKIDGALVKMRDVDFTERTSTAWSGLCQ